MAAVGESTITVTEHARGIFKKIQTFSPEDWKETYNIPEGRAASLLASIFKSAVGIYCCARVPASTVSQEFALWSLVEIAAQRITLLRLLSKAVEFDRQLSVRILWPIAVAGYAARKGTYSERALIGRLLTDMRHEFGCIPPRLSERLHAFWLRAPRVEEYWDDCWSGPFTFLP